MEKQPPLIIALECEIEKKEGPDLPSQRENYDQDKITMLVHKVYFSIDKLVFLVILSVFSITISAYRDARWGY